MLIIRQEREKEKEEHPFFLTVFEKEYKKQSDSQRQIALQFKKAKQAAQVARRQLQDTNKRIHKLQTTASKHQKLAIMAKTRCLKLYEIKKVKLYNKNIFEESLVRKQHCKEKQFEETQKKRLEEQSAMQSAKSKEEEKIRQIRTRMSSYKSHVNRDLQQTNSRISQSCKRIVDQVRKDKSRHAQKKKQMEQSIIEFGRRTFVSRVKTMF